MSANLRANNNGYNRSGNNRSGYNGNTNNRNANMKPKKPNFIDYRTIDTSKIIVEKPGNDASKRMRISYETPGNPLIITTPGKCFSRNGIQEGEWEGKKTGRIQLGFRIYSKDHLEDEEEMKNRLTWIETYKNICETVRQGIRQHALLLDEDPEEVALPPKAKFNKLYYPRDKETKKIKDDVSPSLYTSLMYKKDVDVVIGETKHKGKQIIGTFCDENQDRIKFRPYVSGVEDPENPLYDYFEKSLDVFGMIKVETIAKVSGKYCLDVKTIEGFLEHVEEQQYLPPKSVFVDMGLLKESEHNNPMLDDDDSMETNYGDYIPGETEENISMKNLEIDDENIVDDEEEKVEEVVVEKPKRKVKKTKTKTKE